MLPDEDIGVILIKFFFSLNLVCSYPIMIYPMNQAVEYWFCGCFQQRSNGLYWASNFSRFCVTLSAAIMATILGGKLDKFLGLVGSFACAPLALFFPGILHLKLLAKTRKEKVFDSLLILVSVLIFFFCTIQSIATWNVETTDH